VSLKTDVKLLKTNKMRTIKNSGKILSAWFAVLFVLSMTVNLYGNTVPPGTVKDDLEKAKKAGNAVFLVITGTGATGLDDLVTIANDANKKVKKSAVIKMDRDDAANSELVTKFGVAGVQLPFILVISPKGYAVGGFPGANATADNLVNLIPSPKYDMVLDALNNKKPVFVVAYKQSFTDKATTLATCKSAVDKVPSKATIVEIDMDDAKEATFLKQIGVNTVATSTVTVVINVAGNITGNYTGATDAQTLATAATKVVKSCCAGGSSKGCGSPKK
jgi:hypothetical protein